MCKCTTTITHSTGVCAELTSLLSNLGWNQARHVLEPNTAMHWRQYLRVERPMMAGLNSALDHARNLPCMIEPLLLQDAEVPVTALHAGPAEQ
jgi:hypothetical protein